MGGVHQPGARVVEADIALQAGEHDAVGEAGQADIERDAEGRPRNQRARKIRACMGEVYGRSWQPDGSERVGALVDCSQGDSYRLPEYLSVLSEYLSAWVQVRSDFGDRG